jgi:hypothetical protein
MRGRTSEVLGTLDEDGTKDFFESFVFSLKQSVASLKEMYPYLDDFKAYDKLKEIERELLDVLLLAHQ